jgi:uncharacterized YigZ family protein
MSTVLNTLTEPSDAVWRDRGSKFLAYARKVTQDTDLATFVKELRSRWPDATHHCVAARWNPDLMLELAQDDGEPAGTAGLPILNQLRSRNLINVACVVVRYFGGTQLGKSGLISAYGTAAATCLDNAAIVAVERKNRFRITTSYTEIKLVEYQIRRSGAQLRNSSFTDTIIYDVAVPDAATAQFLADLERIGQHRLRIEPLGSEWAEK